MRFASITYLLVPMLLACSVQAEQKKSDAPKGIGIPGEILIDTPSLEVTWQNYNHRLLRYSLIDRRKDQPLLIGQEAFVIMFADGSMLRSSQMESGSTSTKSLKPKPDGASAAERAGGQQFLVSLKDDDTGVAAKWALTQRNGADYLLQEVVLTSSKNVEIADVRLVTLQMEGAKSIKEGNRVAVDTDTLYFGILSDGGGTSIDGAKVRAGIQKSVKLGPAPAPGLSYVISVIIGAAAEGNVAESFKLALANEEAVAPEAPKAKHEEKKAEKKEAKKEIKREQPKKESPKKEMPAKEVPAKEAPKAVPPPAKSATSFPANVDPSMPVPAGNEFYTEKAAAQKKADVDAAAAAAKQKADADAAAKKAKADAEKAKADAAKQKATDAAAAKAKADADAAAKAKAAAAKPEPKKVEPKKAAAPAQPAPTKPAYKFPANLDPNAVLPAN